MKVILIALLFTFSQALLAQQTDVPVKIILKSGEEIVAKHLGQLSCGNAQFVDSYVLIRGKYMGTPTEIKTYQDFKKIEFTGFVAEPAPSVGNEKATITFYRKDGITVELNEADISQSCYSSGDLFNQISIQLINPLNQKVYEQKIETRNIQSIYFL